jgi:fucose 4-O-acetylase-like acetyltransferase
MSERVRLIDIAKGITIIGVAFSHSHLENFFPGLDHSLALFRMPLFFFLAGIFFNDAIELGNLVYRKTDALLKPYFVTLGAFLLIDIMLESHFMWELKGILYGNGETIKWVGSWLTPLWFLTHLWVLFIFSYLIFSITKIQTKPCYLKVLLVLLLLTAGAAIVDKFWYLPIHINGKIVEIPGLPFSSDLVFISAAYFISGRFLREPVKSFKPKLAFVFLALSSFIFITIFTSAEIDLNLRIYHEPLASTIAAYLGIYLTLSLAYFLDQLALPARVICYVGQASLLILIFHKFFEDQVHSILSHWNFFSQDLYVSILSFACCLTMPLVIRAIVIRSNFLALFYLPLGSSKLLSGGKYRIRHAYSFKP